MKPDSDLYLENEPLEPKCDPIGFVVLAAGVTLFVAVVLITLGSLLWLWLKN